MHVASMLLVAGLALAGVASAQETPPPPEDLIRALGAETFAEREAAEEALRELGEAARPALEGACEDRDPEIRWRVNRLLEDLAARRRGAGTRPAPDEELERLLDQLPDQEPRPLAPRPDEDGARSGSLEELLRDLEELEEGLVQPDRRWQTGRPPPGDRRQDQGLRWFDEELGSFQDLESLLDEMLTSRWGDLEEQVERLQRDESFWQDWPGGNPWATRSRPAPEPGDGPRFGVLADEPGAALRAQLALPRAAGMLVLQVEPGSLASRIGLEQFDIILEVNGVTLQHGRHVAQLRQAAAAVQEGAGLELTIVRRAEPRQLRIEKE